MTKTELTQVELITSELKQEIAQEQLCSDIPVFSLQGYFGTPEEQWEKTAALIKQSLEAKGDVYWTVAYDRAMALSSNHRYIIVPDDFLGARESFWPISGAKLLSENEISAFLLPKDRVSELPASLLINPKFQEFHCVLASAVFAGFSLLEQDVEETSDNIARELPSFEAFRTAYLNEVLPSPATSDQTPKTYDDLLLSLQSKTSELEGCSAPAYYRDLQGNWLKVFVKRVIRKLCKFLFLPVIDQQVEINTRNNQCWSALVTYQKTQTELNYQLQQVEAQTAALEHLQQKIDLQEQWHQKLTAALERLQQKIDLQEQQLQKAHAYEDLLSRQSSQIEILEQKLQHWQDQSCKQIQLLCTENTRLDHDMQCIRHVEPTIFQEENHFFSASQCGEDSIIYHILDTLSIDMKSITYLDLGANHARELSNTYLFYRKGAKGVLVEANPSLIPELKLFRNRDIILNCCVTTEEQGAADFYVFDGDGLSTMDYEEAKRMLEVAPNLTCQKIQVESIPVNQILEEYFPLSPTILSIDLEGIDFDILQAIDYTRFRPFIIIAEVIPYDPQLVVGQKNEAIVAFLKEKGYIEYAYTGTNSIFIDTAQLNRELAKTSAVKKAFQSPGNVVDLLQNMSANDAVERTSNGVLLKKDGVVYGPYLFLKKGSYQLNIKMDLPTEQFAPLEITADGGKESIAAFSLRSGDNLLNFELQSDTKKVEFVIRNPNGIRMILLGVEAL